MGHWGDDTDPEVLNRQDPKGRITLNFRTISDDIEHIAGGTARVDARHPKDELLKEWISIMIAFMIFFTASYKLFVAFTIPLMVFYVICLFRLKSAWKHFGYKMAPAVLITLITLGALFGASRLIQYLVLSLI